LAAWPVSGDRKTLDSTASDPVVAARKESNATPIVAWEHKDGGTTSIRCEPISKP
jgi:hypothetical protein